MDYNESDTTIEVRVFGALRKHLDRQNIPYFFKKKIFPGQMTPEDIALELDIPQDEIEAVFVNGKVSESSILLFPGDRVGLFPYGTPGPYRLFLGIVKKGK